MIDTQTQIKCCRERAMTDIARVVNRGEHVAFSTFDVTSTTNCTYRVQIRSLTEPQNSCTCPHYLTNLVGTCKHIEGVLLNLKEALGDQWDELVAPAPPIIQIYLHHAEETTIRALPVQPVPHEIQAVLDRYFDTSFPATVIGGPGPARRQQYHESSFFKIVNYEIVLPSSRLVNAELVEQGRLPADLAAQLSRARELTASRGGRRRAAPLTGSRRGLHRQHPGGHRPGPAVGGAGGIVKNNVGV
jgi:hypothetical protein